MQVCTIIAKNYVAHARVLARSLAATHPGARLWTLIIDETDGYLDPEREPFATLTPADIGCRPFHSMALRYSVLELSTAVKPWLLRHLMERTGEPVTYLDPDIQVFSSLQRLGELAGRHGLALTPHSLGPIPMDDRRPSQVDVMISGIYNLGYVSVAPRPEIEGLLDWWSMRLERDCRVDPVWGYFVDQRWFDLAPGFVDDIAIVRDPEYNVAYWNLHERALANGDGRVTVNGRPLAFFHFSGFDPDHPLIFSRHQNRTDVRQAPVLRGLLADYAARVLAEGHAESRHWPYGYGALGDGIRVDDRLRALFDEYSDEHHDEHPSPFTVQGAHQLQRWMAEQAPGAPAGISRALLHILSLRSDLRRLYTSEGAIDAPGLLRWVERYADTEEPLLFALMHANGAGSPPPEGSDSVPASPAAVVRASLGAARERDPSSRPPDTAGPLHREPFGVNVVGYFRSEVGTGEAARQMVAALDAVEMPVLPIHGQTIPLSRQGHAYETATPEQAVFPVNLICMNADMLPEFARQAGAEFFDDRYSIGVWFWEVERFPERWRDSFSLLEEVWAPTAHIARALAPLASVPVETVRLPVAPPPAAATSSRAALGLPEDRFVFLFSFDYLSVAERKNALGAIAAFATAFDGSEAAELVVKCINSDHAPEYHARVRAAVDAHPGVRLIDGYLAPADNAGLLAACDSYVSLHRAEGFGLGMAEAMWHGKPVIATGYSGNLDFMNEGNSLLVEHALVPIGPGFAPYPADGVWAQPSVEHAAEQMRHVFEDREFAARIGRAAAEQIRLSHSPAAVGRILADRLEVIRATGRPRPRRTSVAMKTPALAALPLTLRRGPWESVGRHPVREFLRRTLLRAMRPYTLYQRELDSQILDALKELAGRGEDARRDTSLELARMLGELRGASELRDVAQRLEDQSARIQALERRLGGSP